MDKLPKSLQPQAKAMLNDIYLSDTKKNTELAFDKFIKAYEAKYSKATTCLSKDKQEFIAGTKYGCAYFFCCASRAK